MMSNDKASLPQYGINRAGVVYEVPVEGEMNRYMALIEDYDGLERIGSSGAPAPAIPILPESTTLFSPTTARVPLQRNI